MLGSSNCSSVFEQKPAFSGFGCTYPFYSTNSSTFSTLGFEGSISRMPTYKETSYEELRWELYQLGLSFVGMGFNTNNTQENPFSLSPEFSPPANPFSSITSPNPFAPKSSTLKEKSYEEFRWEACELRNKGSSVFGQKPALGATSTPTFGYTFGVSSSSFFGSSTPPFYLGKSEEANDFTKRQESIEYITERLKSMSLESVIPLADWIHELLTRKAAGNEAYKAGKYADAVEHYTCALSCSVVTRPFAAICFCNRAEAYKALGQVVDAIADCSLAIALDPTYHKAISRRASLYEMIRDYGLAAIDIRRLVSLLTSQIDEKSLLSGASAVNELRKTYRWLNNVKKESRRKIPLNMYLILGVESSAAASEIKKAYLKAALKHHPDKAARSVSRSENGDDGLLWKEIAEKVYKDADRLFKMIGEAYAILSNPSKRSRYDMDEEMKNGYKCSKPFFERSASRR